MIFHSYVKLPEGSYFSFLGSIQVIQKHSSPCQEYLDATGDLGGIEDAGNGSIRLKCWKDMIRQGELGEFYGFMIVLWQIYPQSMGL